VQPGNVVFGQALWMNCGGNVTELDKKLPTYIHTYMAGHILLALL